MQGVKVKCQNQKHYQSICTASYMQKLLKVCLQSVAALGSAKVPLGLQAGDVGRSATAAPLDSLRKF